MGCGQSARVSPSTVVVQSTNQDADLQKSKWIQMTSRTVKLVVNGSAMLLVAVDIVGNNWEFNHFVGDAKHFFTPLLTTTSRDELEQHYSFPDHASPTSISNVGRYMIDAALHQIHSRGDDFFITMNTFPIVHPENDICGRLVSTYPVQAGQNNTVRLGFIYDHVTFVRGNTLSHIFADTYHKPAAPPGTNASVLTEMGYVPARTGLDMRLTTTIQVPPPGRLVPLNLTMYRFFSKSFCSGCHPGTELGMDTCSILYSYDNASNAVTVYSSSAIYGQSHVLGFIFPRRWGPMVSVVLRGFCVFMAVAAFGASRKTVRWIDTSSLTSILKKIMHGLAPPLHRQSSHAFDFSYFCFNSDVFVILYSIAVLIDEDVSMVYARVVTTWYKPAPFELWTELRLRALAFRWLWFNLFMVKVMKWLCHFLSTARFNGSNFVMGLFNFSNVPWIYMTVFALFERTDYIEYGNSVRVDVTSVTQDLDSVYVEFESSWYMRGLSSLIFLMVGNLLGVLAVDHFVNRRWWRLMSRNSLGRQHMFNSTSILSDMGLEYEDRSFHSITTIDARVLSTYHWFFASHVMCFGLPEEPSLVRKVASAEVANTGAGRSTNTAHMSGPLLKKTTALSSSGPSKQSLGKSAREAAQSTAVGDTEETTVGEPSESEYHIVIQDQDGYLHLFDSSKHEVAATSMESRIVKDGVYRIG
ncbi:unnamed protein product [Aphanomyces euteiches]